MAIPNRKLNEEQALAIIRECTYGVLSTVDKEGEPYGVGINCFYVEKDHALYFHTKKIGSKVENIGNHASVSVFITDGKEKIAQERFTTHYASAVVKGDAEMITDPAKVKPLLQLLCQRLCPDAFSRREEVINQYLRAVGICKIHIKSISGKQNSDE